MLIIISVVAVALVAIIVVVVNSNRTSAVREPDVLPASTVSGWDDSSPLPSDNPSPTASPSDPEASGTVGPERPMSCDQYDQSETPAQPNDGRVHGGPLSFAELGRRWDAPRAYNRFPYSKDAYLQERRLPERLPWVASAYAGISTVPDYRDGETATAQLLQCLVTSDFYLSVDARLTENGTKSTLISNTPAVQRDALLRFEHPDLETTGSRVRIIIVESTPLTFYFHAVPMERDDLIDELDGATRSLRLG